MPSHLSNLLKVDRSALLHAWIVGTVCLGLLAAISSAYARDNAFDSQVVLEALNDDEYRIREEATQRLLQRADVTFEKLEQLFTQAETLEQQQRLLRVAQHHVLRLWVLENYDQTDFGSLGITHQKADVAIVPSGYQAGIIVRSTFPGFPGHAYLKPNDMILAFNDENLVEHIDAQHFARIVRMTKAGHEILLDVYRNGEILKLPIALAPGVALASTYDGPNFSLGPLPSIHWHRQKERLLQKLPERP